MIEVKRGRYMIALIAYSRKFRMKIRYLINELHLNSPKQAKSIFIWGCGHF
jgi:hypothetical protein